MMRVKKESYLNIDLIATLSRNKIARCWLLLSHCIQENLLLSSEDLYLIINLQNEDKA
jgi:hypothetical protein